MYRLTIFIIYLGLPVLAWASEPCSLLIEHSKAIEELAARIQEREAMALDTSKATLVAALKDEIAAQQSTLLAAGIAKEILELEIQKRIEAGIAQEKPSSETSVVVESVVQPPLEALSATEKDEMTVAIAWATSASLRIAMALEKAIEGKLDATARGLILATAKSKQLYNEDPTARLYNLNLDLNTPLPGGKLPIVYAVEQNLGSVAMALISYGAQIPSESLFSTNTQKTDIGIRPFVMELIARGHRFSEWDAIHLAGNPDLVLSAKAVFEHQPPLRNAKKESIGQNTTEGMKTVFTEAVLSKNRGLKRYLIEKNVDYSEVADLLRPYYTSKPDEEIFSVIEDMVAKGFVFTAEDMLTFAENNGAVNSAKAILASNPALKDVESEFGGTVLSRAVKADNWKLVDHLIQMGIDTDARNEALVYAARHNAWQALKVLIIAGTPASDEALAAAITAANYQPAKILLLAGANPKVLIREMPAYDFVKKSLSETISSRAEWETMEALLKANGGDL